MRTLLDTACDGPGTYLKWAGNKGFLAKKHPGLVALPEPGGRWREAFTGSGGLFYTVPALQPGAVLTDCNARLIATHVAIRDEVEEVIEHLEHMRWRRWEAEKVGDAEVKPHYYRLRDLFNNRAHPPTGAFLAALLIALNHLCVNGLYRENADGDFNVSIGAFEKPPLFDAEKLRACSRALAGADIRVMECEAAIDLAEPGDALLLDPPYAPVSSTASFTGYAGDSGDWNALPAVEQSLIPGCGHATKRERLAAKLDELTARGVRFTLTDSDTEVTRALYRRSPRHTLTPIQVSRSISRDGAGRKPASELVVRNWA